MKKVIIALFCCLASTANAELVKDNKDNTVNNIDLNVLLETAPRKEQRKLLNNREKLKGQLEQLYLRKVLAEMAKRDGLDKETMNAARLQAIIDNALFLLKLDALKKSNKKDYTKYAQQIYQVNKSDYTVEARVDAAHILISTKTLSDEQALAKAQEIRKQLVNGANFAELALKESDDKSVKRNKGELGKFTKGQMVKPFSDVVFTMQVGELSEPVKTQYGYHLIKLNKKFPAGIKPFADVKDGIINKLKAKDWEVARAEFYEQVKENNMMVIDEPALDEFVEKKLVELESQ